MGAQLHFHLDGVSLQIEYEVVRLEGRQTTERIQPWPERHLIWLAVSRREAGPAVIEGINPSMGEKEAGMDVTATSEKP